MKNLFLVLAASTVFVSTAMAESIICASKDGSMKAEIAEDYHHDGSFLAYRLYWIEENSENIYSTWFYNIITENKREYLGHNLEVRITPGIMEVIRHEGIVTLECRR